MDLSIIIVNYNVKHFVEQCLHSVYSALKNISAEIFVVDNNSVDGSNQLINEKFPQVKLIENSVNVGFSKANNQAIRQSKGKYVLLLNPDTVVEEDTFAKVIDFMNHHPDAGGLGVKMIDGKGNFLPESKRGLPTPWVAFYKMFGLSRLFPKSKKFSRYHLSYLDKNETHQVDVLAGAFMLLRKSVLDEIGLLDETFFMYGEDIDLSYRITLGGYKNYYFPETTIIHYKGESTKKGSLNYVKVFYNAMIIFANKHFSSGRVKIFSFLIQIAIYLRAFFTIIKKVLAKILVPLIDVLLIFIGFLVITPIWESYKYYDGYYPETFYHYAVSIYTLIWITAIYLSGGYQKPLNILKSVRGIIWGLIAILVAYSLLDDNYRFSRALIIFGTIWSLLIIPLVRYILSKTGNHIFQLERKKDKRYVIVGNRQENLRVKELMIQSSSKTEFTGFISLNDKNKKGYLGSVDQLKEIIQINKVDEIIFCSSDLSSAEIIQLMSNLTTLDIEYKIAPPESISIIGSNSIHTAGEFYVLNVSTIVKKSNRIKKRVFDVFTSIVLLLISPITIWFYANKPNYYSNCLEVLNGSISWVGFVKNYKIDEKLPNIKNGVLSPKHLLVGSNINKHQADQINMIYAKDYKVSTDLEILLKGWRHLDQKYER